MSWMDDLRERLDEALPGLVVKREQDRIAVFLPSDVPEEDPMLAHLIVNPKDIEVRLESRVDHHPRTAEGVEGAFAAVALDVINVLHERRRYHHVRAVAYGRLVGRL